MAEDKFALARNVLVNAIRPALNTLEMGGLAVEQLILGTGIQESLLVHRQQLGGGPALGVFQMERATPRRLLGEFPQMSNSHRG
jgi:hypothetical protein